MLLMCGIVFLCVKQNIGKEKVEIVKNKNNGRKTFFEVYVCGKVVFPGVYRVSSKDSLKAVLERAGIEEGSGEAQLSVISSSAAINKYININFVNQKELEQLPGIGKKLAERIISYRKQHNGFKTKEELKNVNGIGEKKFNAIADFVRVSASKTKEIPVWIVIRASENNKSSRVSTQTAFEEIFKLVLNLGSSEISKYVKLELK